MSRRRKNFGLKLFGGRASTIDLFGHSKKKNVAYIDNLINGHLRKSNRKRGRSNIRFRLFTIRCKRKKDLFLGLKIIYIRKNLERSKIEKKYS
jgi:hypothetical protein